VVLCGEDSLISEVQAGRVTLTLDAQIEKHFIKLARMKTFKRKIYHSLGEWLTDLRIITSQRKEIRSLMQGKLITPAFRERLMLVVTSVHQCRYCSYAHAREALSKGISREEIEALGQRMFEGSPSEEVPALLYAQHWAESNGEPETSVREQVAAQYGEQVVRLMELALRMIRVGNLSGNTFDYLLYRISFGQWGHS
jgi:AhpD family alkylhydroperoxidase